MLVNNKNKKPHRIQYKMFVNHRGCVAVAVNMGVPDATEVFSHQVMLCDSL